MNVGNQHYRSIWESENRDYVNIIDQTKLPFDFEIIQIKTLTSMEKAISTMQVRGAPLIGASAAYGVALAMHQDTSNQYLKSAADLLIASRPTAVNLQWAVQRMLNRLITLPESQRLNAAWQEAAKICDEDVLQNQAIAKHGLSLLKAIIDNNKQQKPLNVLTHCNAGWLATVDGGTALAPIYAAHDAGIAIHVWVDETRPRNQGANLTAWELFQHGVPHTVIVDNAGGHLMQQGLVDCVIVGADRIASNGDVCNKIGTYLKALAAFDNQVPFYVMAPSNTFDNTLQSGVDITIEDRVSDEVASMVGLDKHGDVCKINIMNTIHHIANPAFDITPSKFVTNIITEHGLTK